MTRMFESRPVAACVALSAASECSAENVFARKAGTVHERALPRTVERRNCRLVCKVISFFIIANRYIVTSLHLELSGELILRRAHDEADGVENGVIAKVFFRGQIITQSFFLLGFQFSLQETLFEGRDKSFNVGTLVFREEFGDLDAAHTNVPKPAL